jgi:magnesium transporter
MLINCVAYQEGKKLCDIDVDAISDYLEKPDCFVWVGFRDPTEDELAKMREEFDLHELAVEDAARGHQRPKVEEYGDSLFAVMHTVDLEGDELITGEVAVFAGPNYALSIRRDVKQGFMSVRARAEREEHLLKMGSAFVLYALMDAVVDRYFPVIDALESELETIEDRIFSDGAQRQNVERLYQIKRKGLVLRHAVAPLLDAMGNLVSGRGVPPLVEGTRDYFRDVQDHLIRISGRLDAMRDTVSTAIQVNLAMVSIDESEVNKRLAAWAAIFAVFTAFAGVWGMNFKVMPELEWRWGYPAAIAVMVAVCGYMYWRFRKSGWL